MAAAQTQQPAPAAHLTVIDRVAAIPLVSDSLNALHATLSSYALTRQPYAYAHTYASAIAASPYVAATQQHLAPVITRADGLANYAVDALEKRVPYAFEANTERVVDDLKSHREHAYGVAEKTLDERLRTPAVGIATGIDQRFTPVVDRFASVVDSLQSKAPEAPNGVNGVNGTNGVNGSDKTTDAYQYQRAYRLSLNLTETLLALSGAQIRQIQEHNGLVQRASETAHTLTNLLSSSLTSLTTQIHALSTQMLTDLSHLQSSLASLPSSLSAHASTSYAAVSARLDPAIGDVKGVLGDRELPVQEKVGRLRKVLEERVVPLLGEARASVVGAVGTGRKKAEKKQEGTKEGVNGVYEEAHQTPALVAA